MGKILCVDDEPEILNLLEDLLGTQGLQAVTALDANEAYQAIEHEKPALILLDVMLPKVSGWEICKKLKSDEKTKDIPIIFVSVLNKKEDIDKGLAIGAADFVSKPFDPKDLIGRIKKLIG